MKTVHLETPLHKILKIKATNEDSTIEKIIHTILKKELNNKDNKNDKKD